MCSCILDQTGSVALNLWRNTDRRLSLVTQASSLSLSPQHCCLLNEPAQHQVYKSLASSVSECPKETPWTRIILNMQDIFPSITKNINLATQRQTTTMNRPDRFIILCDEDIQSQLFSDICCIQDCRTLPGNTACQFSDNDNVSGDLKNSTADSPSDPNNNYENEQKEIVIRDNVNVHRRKSLLKSCQNNNRPEDSGSDRKVKMRKSVSFDDDVTVYLIEQESPTEELHSEACTSLPSDPPCNLSDVTLEDSGLEWEDDFSALEKNCHFQCISPSGYHGLSLPTPSWAAPSRPERYLLSQTSLILTHVMESDLEL
ncbi:serine/threonine-protein kinase LMTK1-like [Echeneis naucrates]|uniref:serine/threonine-protein kinase LMTK1-like n=1 Tax=Echeneis naucrates TaxID=173247 RepID=UPI001113BD13|nr:serine/threonine-protein kinase LMTK1-like [Echeneis naucrates]